MDSNYLNYLKDGLAYLGIAGVGALSLYNLHRWMHSKRELARIEAKAGRIEGKTRGLQTLLHDLQSAKSAGDGITGNNIAHVMTVLLEEDLPELSESFQTMRFALESHNPQAIKNAQVNLLEAITRYVQDRYPQILSGK